VGRSLIVESTFLIDLEREHARGVPGRAVAFLETHDDARLYLPFTVAGELAAGVSLADRARWQAFLGPFFVLHSTADVSWEYGRLFRYLRDSGRLIGSNDMWIAATALAYRMPVVTANLEHYRRVPDLEVLEY
jgi:predicted nucleic acid-binding protein